jgi:hypothetical protein
MFETSENPAIPSERIRSAVELCAYHQIKLKNGRELLRSGQSPQQFYERLRDHDYLPEARRVLTHALPKRRALWWACICAAHAQPVKPAPLGDAVIAAVTRFVLDPSDERRRATLPLGKAAGFQTLPGNLAMAAFFSGGSVSDPGLPPVAPRPFVTGRLTSVTIYLAAVRRNPARYKDVLRQYLDLGLAIARGQHLWISDDIDSLHEPVLLSELAARGALV